jgi:hypothetical protein
VQIEGGLYGRLVRHFEAVGHWCPVSAVAKQVRRQKQATETQRHRELTKAILCASVPLWPVGATDIRRQSIYSSPGQMIQRASYEAVTTVLIPPRTVKSPITVIRLGCTALTRSSRI